MNFRNIHVQRDGLLAVVTINRPDALNALDTTQATELLLTGLRKTSTNAEFLKWVERELSKESK